MQPPNEPEPAKSPQEIRDLMLAWLDDHKRQCKDRSGCIEPANLLAFLAHSAGLRLSNLEAFKIELAHYEATCAGCQHLRN